MARLIVVSGAPDGGDRTVELTGDSVTVGREATNGIVLDKEAKASRRHCQVVEISGGAFEVSDLKSTNGTRVNGEAIERRRLRHGDTIEVGLTKIRFEDPVAAAAQAATGDLCYLEWTKGDRKGDRIALSAARTTFGRRETNTVPLEDKMASGHHAEVTKDLNGFTVRDLGSTNGTLVNGEPITEVILKHGDRVRVGNARFVFKDPAMKDVEVAGDGDEDDVSWGMMAEVDASRAKGGGKGLAIAALLVGALGAGVWYANGQVTPETADIFGSAANQIDDGTFESDVLSWSVDDGIPASVERATAGGAPKGGPYLLVKRTDAGGSGAVFARYNEDLVTKEGAPYRVSARMKRDGAGPAALAVQWSRLGNSKSGSTSVTQTVRIGSPEKAGAWGRVERVVRRPSWAQSARLVVVVGPDATARVDDVVVEDAPSAVSGAPRVDGEKGIDVLSAATGGLDLVRTSTVLAVGATPWARFPDGRVVGGPAAFVPEGAPSASEGGFEVKGRLADESGSVPASVRWAKSPEGLLAVVTVAGAEAVGLSADFPLAHLTEQLKVRAGPGSKVVEPSPGIELDGATRVLLGDAERRADVNRPETLLALDVPAAATKTRLSTGASDDPGLLRVTLWQGGAAGEFHVVMNFDGERQQAKAALRDAKTLVDKSPGPGIKALDRVAEEYPFEAEIRNQALAAARAREERASKDAAELQRALDLFAVYRDRSSLDDVVRKAEALDAQFPPADAEVGIPATIRSLVAQTTEARIRHDVETAGPEVKRLSRLARLLEQEKGFEVVAAIYFDTVVRRFGDLEVAGAKVGAAELGSEIKDCREHRDALLAKPEVRAAFPNLQ